MMTWALVKPDFASVFGSHYDTLINGTLTDIFLSTYISEHVPTFSYEIVPNFLDSSSEFATLCSRWVT